MTVACSVLVVKWHTTAYLICFLVNGISPLDSKLYKGRWTGATPVSFLITALASSTVVVTY